MSGGGANGGELCAAYTCAGVLPPDRGASSVRRRGDSTDFPHESRLRRRPAGRTAPGQPDDRLGVERILRIGRRASRPMMRFRHNNNDLRRAPPSTEDAASNWPPADERRRFFVAPAPPTQAIETNLEPAALAFDRFVTAARLLAYETLPMLPMRRRSCAPHRQIRETYASRKNRPNDRADTNGLARALCEPQRRRPQRITGRRITARTSNRRS